MTLEQQPQFNLITLDSTDSTNNYLKQLAKEELVPEFTLVRSKYQTAGKGQRGNYWESAPGQNLLFSLLVRPKQLPIQEQFILSEVVSISLVQTLQRYASDFSIKWPNDIYWKDYKICGILIEHDLLDKQIAQSIIGIGLNINQTEFKSDAPNPVSLTQITGKRLDCTQILAEFCQHFASNYTLMQGTSAPALINLYRDLLYRGQGLFYFADKEGIFQARIDQVETNGRIHLIDNEGKRRSYLFKEVQYLKAPDPL